ncbi:hypothetical protein [Bacillus altitudinis]|uniref:hypothetical protein n=1 Tax=Bacillus altitudinis TaxID=293387 RepID=UPI00307D9FEA
MYGVVKEGGEGGVGGYEIDGERGGVGLMKEELGDGGCRCEVRVERERKRGFRGKYDKGTGEMYEIDGEKG